MSAPPNIPKCALCGEPMPEGEEMFQYHGYSGDCPKPPLPTTYTLPEAREALGRRFDQGAWGKKMPTQGLDYDIDRLCKAQHVATRKAVLEEVRAELSRRSANYYAVRDIIEWLDTQLAGGDE